ncbi:hypothetical protein H5T53_04005 [Candidatus Bipolaricaulota bacterium]|nr:hypothetical protein [Candidatus Bipolaricaulota bacterium]
MAKTGVLEFGRLVGELGKKVADLAVRGATFTAQHPIATNLGLGVAGGVTSTVITSVATDQPITLKGIGIGVASGLAGAGGTYVAAQFAPLQAQLPINLVGSTVSGVAGGVAGALTEDQPLSIAVGVGAGTGLTFGLGGYYLTRPKQP